MGDVVVGFLDVEAPSGHLAAQRSVAAICPSRRRRLQQIDRIASLSVSRSLGRFPTFAKIAPAATGACVERPQSASVEVLNRG